MKNRMIRKLRKERLKDEDIRASLYSKINLFWDENIKSLYSKVKLFRHLTISFSFEYPKGYSLSKEIQKGFLILKERT